MHNGFCKLANPPDVPDIAPSDFSFFDKGKTNWSGSPFRMNMNFSSRLLKCWVQFRPLNCGTCFATGSLGWNRSLIPMMSTYHEQYSHIIYSVRSPFLDGSSHSVLDTLYHLALCARDYWDKSSNSSRIRPNCCWDIFLDDCQFVRIRKPNLNFRNVLIAIIRGDSDQISNDRANLFSASFDLDSIPFAFFAFEIRLWITMRVF
jgi:hypothetical protein